VAKSGIACALRSGQIPLAVERAQDLLQQPELAPESMIHLADPDDRPRLVTLLRDIITEYPHTLLGAPVLIRWRSSRATIELPVPDSLDPAPSAGLEFVAWLPLDSRIPASLPRPGVPPATVTIASHRIQCAVALFRATPDAPDPDQHDISHDWWATLFSETPQQDSVYLSARMLLPYPDALEAAQVLYRTAFKGKPPTQLARFLSDDAWAWAVDAGLQYRRQLSEI